eukprot:TRINITY_DN4940_c0_g1_i1.p1 TRINITY_DN4940_c0_g1~~TRINITY_DN4940_c0_g1_i1.p1  ORF type:complete len:968 (+),score=194.32 TRINITY_DN4940_c0_g1_i1:136-3039(+)
MMFNSRGRRDSAGQDDFRSGIYGRPSLSSPMSSGPLGAPPLGSGPLGAHGGMSPTGMSPTGLGSFSGGAWGPNPPVGSGPLGSARGRPTPAPLNDMGAGSPTMAAKSRNGSMISPSLAELVMEVESKQELENEEMLQRTQFPQQSLAPSMPQLSANGQYDDLLLRPGGSGDLARLFPGLYKDEPPPDGGRRPAMYGRFHNFTNTFGSKVFSPAAVVRLLGLAEKFWGRAPNLLKLTVPQTGRIVVVGDTHGQLEDLIWMFFKYGVPSKNNQYLIVGDIVDRGGHALEILLLLFAFKRDDPESIHILRGNHEDLNTTSSGGFRAELETKFGPSHEGGWVYHFVTTKVFPTLQLAAVVTDAANKRPVFCVHGGIPVRCPGYERPLNVEEVLPQLNRFVPTIISRQTPEEMVLYNLLWADPVRPNENYQHSGRGHPFTDQDTLHFCQMNQVSCVIRAHQPPPDLAGFECLHQNRCITVFSASNYTGCLGNRGGVLLCDAQTFGTYGPQGREHFAPPWPELATVLRKYDIVTSSPETRKQVCATLGGDTNAPKTPQIAKQRQQGQIAQVEHAVVDAICKKKQELFAAFAAADPHHLNVISLQVWEMAMEKTLQSEMNFPRHVWPELARNWQLGEDTDASPTSGARVPAGCIAYVDFLHRFKIQSVDVPVGEATHVDALQAMSRLQLEVSDLACDSLLQQLDRDFNGKVDFKEWVNFLQSHGTNIPQWQTAALFEAMIVCLGRSPTVEDAILSVALMSRRPVTANASSPGCINTLHRIGLEIERSGETLVGFFRKSDVDRSGFLDLLELKGALDRLLHGSDKKFTDDQVKQLMDHMDSLQRNGRVSLVEFLRAVGSPKLGRNLLNALLEEILKPVYFHKAMLLSFLARFDPAHSNKVSLEEFRAAVNEMNRQLKERGEQALTDYQMAAVCEIASGTQDHVQYRAFLQSLKVVDAVKMQTAALSVRHLVQAMM